MKPVFRTLDQERDLDTYVQLMNAFQPEHSVTPEEQRVEFQQWPPGAYAEDWVMEREGHAVAVCGLFDPHWASAPDRYGAYWTGQDQQLWSPAWHHLAQVAQDRKAREISAWSTSLRPAFGAFLEDQGFRLIEQAPTTELNVTEFEEARFVERIERAAATGYRFCSVAELAEEGIDWPGLVHQALCEIREDLPGEDAATSFTLDEYRRDLEIGGEVTHPKELIWVALDGTRVAAYSRLQPAGTDPTLLRTGLSGSVRRDRRKGLVTALKVRLIQTARRRGVTKIQTDNHETNPMLGLNYELGFRDVYVHQHYRLYLDAGGASR